MKFNTLEIKSTDKLNKLFLYFLVYIRLVSLLQEEFTFSKNYKKFFVLPSKRRKIETNKLI